MQIQNNTYRLQLNMAPTIILAVPQELGDGKIRG